MITIQNRNSLDRIIHIMSTVAVILAITILTSFNSFAQSTEPDITTFFENSKFSSAKLSPDGTSVAMLIVGKDERKILATMDVKTLSPQIAAKWGDADIVSFHWVNNTRLVYSLGDSKTAQSDSYRFPGLFAVNKDGTFGRQLIEVNSGFVKEHRVIDMLPWHTYFADVIHDKESDEIFVVRDSDPYHDSKTTSFDLLRLNTVNGRFTVIKRPATNVTSWLIDRDGIPRIATSTDKSKLRVHYKKPNTDDWQVIKEFDSFSSSEFSPLFFAPDGTLLVTAKNNADTRSVYRFNLETKSLEAAPLITLKGYDFSGELVINSSEQKILGAVYETDAWSTIWFNDRMNEIQKKVDSYLPATVNLITVPENGKINTILIKSFSDVQPPIWYLYHVDSEKFSVLGNSHPKIDRKQMAYMDFTRIKVRDGLEIPVYLTLPKVAKKNLPMVVLVHGGPYLRGGHWAWNPEVQFLASRGYAVLEPDFRGSTGYGDKLFKAGWKQWGLSMQDDVTDATKWAIAQGYADPKRICIAGASYGGYAALMGLIKEPNLYRCGINWVGVTDINLLFDVAWSDLSSEWEKYGMPMLVGDQTKDANQLKQTSPLENAKQITQPLLMAYGGVDRRVPIIHGEKLYKAVKANNPSVEWVEYPEEGHGWSMLKNRIDFWTRVERFLQKNTAPHIDK